MRTQVLSLLGRLTESAPGRGALVVSLGSADPSTASSRTGTKRSASFGTLDDPGDGTGLDGILGGFGFLRQIEDEWPPAARPDRAASDGSVDMCTHDLLRG